MLIVQALRLRVQGLGFRHWVFSFRPRYAKVHYDECLT